MEWNVGLLDDGLIPSMCVFILGTLNVATVTDFVDGGGNLLVAASSDVSELLRELAAEVGG